MASSRFPDFCRWLNILANAPLVIASLPCIFRPSRDLGKVFGCFECYNNRVPDETSALHNSQICAKFSSVLVRQGLLDFRFQHVIFKENPEAGTHHPEFVNNPGSVPLGKKYL